MQKVSKVKRFIAMTAMAAMLSITGLGVAQKNVQAAIEHLKSCITHFYFAFDVEVSISTFTSGRAFLDSYTEKGQYQLIFMDVEMPELNGLDTASIHLKTIIQQTIIQYI